MSNILDTEISLFNSCYSPNNPTSINLLAYLQGALNNKPFARPPKWLYNEGTINPEHKRLLEKKYIGKPLKDVVKMYRKDRQANGQTAFNKLVKKLLPAVTVSGTFKKRDKTGLINHSGFICLDVDYKDNVSVKNYDHLKQQLCNLVNVAYCGLSVSGTGFFIIVPILFPNNHLLQFESLRIAFSELGLMVDENCSDVSRLRVFSVDSEGYFNPDPVTFKRAAIPKRPKRVKAPKTDKAMNAKVEKLVKEIEKRETDLTSTYKDWVNLGFSFAKEFGESGRDYYHTISQFYPNYNPNETDNQFDRCLKGESKATINSFYKLCGDNDIMIKDLYQSNRATALEDFGTSIINEFLEDKDYKPNRKKYTPLKSLYKEYKSYCQENELGALIGYKLFAKHLRELKYLIKRKVAGRVVFINRDTVKPKSLIFDELDDLF